MKITEIKVHPVEEGRLRAFVTIVIEGCLVIRDIKIIFGPKGLFVAMPSKKRKDGQYKDTVHPVNKETRLMIESLIFEEYGAQVSGMAA